MDKSDRAPPAFGTLLWPAVAAAAVGGFARQVARGLAGLSAAPETRPPQPEPQWTTANSIVRELSAVRLRDFSTAASGVPTLLCAPYALHAANILDFATGHSVVAALSQGGCGRLFATDWRSATADMRFFSIDTYLSELNVLVDDLGGTVDLVGACQGGWLALSYAARFPGKVRKLVLAAAPIDLEAGESRLSRLARDTPLIVFKNMVELGDGRMPGTGLLELWGSTAPDRAGIADVLQVPEANWPGFAELEARFRTWYAWTLDLPGTYYLEAVERLFKQNQLASGRFVALGQTLDLAHVRCPMYLLAGRDDDVVAPSQLMAVERLVGTPAHRISKEIAPTGHLGLFVGRNVVAEQWPRVAQWLAQPARKPRRPSPARTPGRPRSDARPRDRGAGAIRASAG
jgi:poly(3-hydroxyalkanoate) synthetase